MIFRHAPTDDPGAQEQTRKIVNRACEGLRSAGLDPDATRYFYLGEQSVSLRDWLVSTLLTDVARDMLNAAITSSAVEVLEGDAAARLSLGPQNVKPFPKRRPL